MQKRDYYFRCQYQKEDVCISVVIRDNEHISAERILISLAKLAVKVRREVNFKTACRVALQVLKIHEQFIESVQFNKLGNGNSKSYYLNKQSKNQNNKSERIDLEFYGNYGQLKDFNDISKYIKYYRVMKGWHTSYIIVF
jgi:hypothetical protein